MSEPRALTGVLVSLDYQPIASYAGGAPGLAPTSPSVTDQRLGQGSPAELAFEEHIVRIEQEFESVLNTAVPEARITAASGSLSVASPGMDD
jgi:hypothetical protein